jgi:hypothetical protein
MASDERLVVRKHFREQAQPEEHGEHDKARISEAVCAEASPRSPPGAGMNAR